MNRDQKDWNRPFPKSGTPVKKHLVKICSFCGTLNHEENAECWMCRWHGAFSRDQQTINLAWKRLETLYEDVRLEHVTSKKMRALGDFGADRPTTRWQQVVSACVAWWQRLQTQRDLRSAQREANLRTRLRSRPDQLGV